MRAEIIDDADWVRLQLYVGPPSIPHLHFAVPPSALLSRLSSHSTSPPHPALLLSLIPLLLPLSPSTLLSSSFRSEQIISNLSAPNLAHSHAALSSADARIIDIVAASCLSGIRSYQGARFLEGWGASTAPTAMAWAAGLGKLGGVGESFVGGGVARERKMAREKRLREIRYKGTVAEPPKNGKELGERIHLLSVVMDKLFPC